MKIKTKAVLFLFVIIVLGQSCKKNKVTAVSSSRDIKYEITGTYGGSIDIAAVTNNGVAEAFEIAKLPWSTQFTAKQSINQLFATATGTGGTAGQTATLKIYVGGKVVSTSNATALSSGIITISSDLYILK